MYCGFLNRTNHVNNLVGLYIHANMYLWPVLILLFGITYDKYIYLVVFYIMRKDSFSKGPKLGFTNMITGWKRNSCQIKYSII